MTNKTELLPCPFCGGKAERYTLTDDANAGGDVIACTKCDACTRVVFGEKEGLVDSWNRRAAPAEDVRAVVEEPVMRLECEKLWGGDGEYAVDFVKPGWLEECRQKGGTFLLYRHPQRQVVLPERKILGHYAPSVRKSVAAYNQAIDDCEELNK